MKDKNIFEIFLLIKTIFSLFKIILKYMCIMNIYKFNHHNKITQNKSVTKILSKKKSVTKIYIFLK